MDLPVNPEDSFLVKLSFWLDPRHVFVSPIESDPVNRWVYLEVAKHLGGCSACVAREEQVQIALRGTRVPYATVEMTAGDRVRRFYRFALPVDCEPVEQLAELLKVEVRRVRSGPLIPLEDLV